MNSLVAQHSDAGTRPALPASLFKPTARPTHAIHASTSIGDWFTWSDRLRADLHAWVEVSEIPQHPPVLRRLDPHDRYSATFVAHQPSALHDVDHRLIAHATALFHADIPTDRLVFLTCLMDEAVDRDCLRALFAFWRDCIASAADDEWSALYAPLGDTGPSKREFPLHADLYRTHYLFNIFDDVPPDESGRALFCRMSLLFDACHDAGAPAAKLKELEALLLDGATDGFEHFLSLLNAPSQPWSDAARRQIQSQALALQIRPGDGYVLHDRSWLHGREAPTGGVPPSRVHRMTFDTAVTHRHRGEL